MRRALARSCSVALLAAGALGVGSFAGAAVPSPANSTLPACIAVCPQGDLTFDVLVRDLSNNPVMNTFVLLDFSACPSFQHCDQSNPYTYDDDSRFVGRLTDIYGDAFFALKMGGICPDSHVMIYADGVLLGARSLASPDRNGTLDVRGDDLAAIHAISGTGDPTADLNCSALVDDDDLVLATTHLGHTCSGIVDVRSHTWGALKLHYR